MKEVARAIGTDSRIGPKFLWHRFPHPHRCVDTKPLAHQKVYVNRFLDVIVGTLNHWGEQIATDAQGSSIDRKSQLGVPKCNRFDHV